MTRYYDIFFSIPLATVEDIPHGVLIDMPGHLQAIVYAASKRIYDDSKDYEEGTPLTPQEGYLHCLVNEAQLAKIEEDHIPFKFFDKASNRYKRGGTYPNHVFNPAGCVYKKNGKDYIYRVGAETEEELDPEIEE